MFWVMLCDEQRLTSFKARTVLAQQRLQDRPVTAGLVCAVAPHGKGGALRKGSQETEEPRGRRTLHLGSVALDETLPLAPAPNPEPDLDQSLGRSQLWQPDVVEIA